LVGENEGQFAELKEHVAQAQATFYKRNAGLSFSLVFCHLIMLNISAEASIMAITCIPVPVLPPPPGQGVTQFPKKSKAVCKQSFFE
jgi:hypothetical protein